MEHALQCHLLLAGAPASFLDPDPDGEGRVPFFGRTVPLFTVGRSGRVAIIGLAGLGENTTTKERFKKKKISNTINYKDKNEKYAVTVCFCIDN